MRLNKDIIKFNNKIKKITCPDKDVFEKINKYFLQLKEIFLKHNLHLKKVGDFAYNTFTSTKKVFDLDLCVVKYVSKKIYKFSEFHKLVLEIAKKCENVKEIHTDKNYINIIFNFKNNVINFRVVPSLAYNKEQETKYEIFRNGIVQEDLLVTLTKDFQKANKLSSGLLFSLKKLINYVLNGEFIYSYNIDFILLRWFYEYVAKSLESYIFKNYIKKEREFNIENFLKIKNFRNWIKKNISFFELANFIFLKENTVNTYYFNKFNFELEEIFEGISRYSVNTNTGFKMPIDYFCDLKIFDTNSIERKTYIQNHLSNENGISDVSWSKYKNQDHRYIVSPIIKTGIANFPMYKKWIVEKANELYLKLSEDLKSEIKTTKQREAMSSLNEIANTWLSKYYLKIKYLQPFFDKKYPFASTYSPEDLADLIIRSINVINQDDWIIKNDN